MENNWKTDFKNRFKKAVSLEEISNLLKEAKNANIGKDEVRDYLNYLRANSSNEEIEDKILEALDIIEGFCNDKYKVW
jgi:uncharacterized membrane protein YvbJ